MFIKLNSSDLCYFTEFNFASFLTWEGPKTNKTMDILNYNNNFVLDIDSFKFYYF